ncbi:MAG: PspC domain-containing protein [Ignavibacteria bacterium]|nr:PspC domain-containing protein [Ignavibacteria bacterium]
MPDPNEVKRLYKSRTDRMIDGVCGGVAEYFGLDSTLVRIAWVILICFGGIGALLYVVAMILMPANPSMQTASPLEGQSSTSNQRFWGILLVVVGVIFLMSNLGVSIWFPWWGLSWSVLLPIVLILAGVAFLFGGRRYVSSSTPSPETGSTEVSETTSGEQEPSRPVHRLYRSRLERKLFGVCGGLADYFNIDPTIVRLIFVVSACASFGLTLLIYIIMAIVVPEESLVSQAS